MTERRRGLRRRLRRGLILAGLLVGLWLVASLIAAQRLTRRARPPFAEPTPRVAWGAVEALRIATRDGEELGAWYVEGREAAPSVLLLHGHNGSRAAWLGRAPMLAARGCALLMISFRAHGDSTGAVNDVGYSGRHDVVAAVEYLERRRPGRPIVVFGQSMGAAAALFAAEELAGRVRGYILECPYRDLKTAVRRRTELYLPPILGRAAYLGLVAVAPLVIDDLEKISPLAAIAGVPGDVPILILAGGGDRKARPEESRALFERAKAHAALRIFEGADHARLFEADPDLYRASILGFLDTTTTPVPSRTTD
jgi:uncharacterized protein